MANGRMIVPPGGFAGFSQMTPAVQALLGRSPGRPTTRRKTRKKTTRKKTTRRSTRRTTAKKKPARLVKGSAAAKRHMAKLRRMRKKKR